MLTGTVASLLAMASLVVALQDRTGSANGVASGPVPLAPDNGAVGGPCFVTWAPDPSGTWNQTNIELMTGPDNAKIHVTTLTTVDTTGTGPTTFNWTCSDVTPTSAIYFYQFSHAEVPGNLIETPRFAITGPNGETTTPQYAYQPDGAAVPWGIGDLVNPKTRKAAPSYVTGEIATPSQAPANITASVAAATYTTGGTSSPSAATSTSTSGAMKNAGSVGGMGLVGAIFAFFVAL